MHSVSSLPPPPAELQYFWRCGKLPQRPLVEKPVVEQPAQAQPKLAAKVKFGGQESLEPLFTPSPRLVDTESSSLPKSVPVESCQVLHQRPTGGFGWEEVRPRSAPDAKKFGDVWAETLAFQLGAEDDLSEVQKISEMVFMNCESLQQRIQEMHQESALTRDRQTQLEDRSHILSEHNVTLETKCSDLVDANAFLRQQLERIAALSTRGEAIQVPVNEAVCTEPPEHRSDGLTREQMLHPRTNHSDANLGQQLDLGLALRSQAPRLPDNEAALVPELVRLQEEALSEEAANRAATHNRIAALERDMAAVHDSVQNLRRVQRPGNSVDMADEGIDRPNGRVNACETCFVQPVPSRGPPLSQSPQSNAVYNMRLNEHLEYLRLRVAESKVAAHAAGMAIAGTWGNSPEALTSSADTRTFEEQYASPTSYDPHRNDRYSGQPSSWGLVRREDDIAKNSPVAEAVTYTPGNASSNLTSSRCKPATVSAPYAFENDADALRQRLRILEEEAASSEKRALPYADNTDGQCVANRPGSQAKFMLESIGQTSPNRGDSDSTLEDPGFAFAVQDAGIASGSRYPMDAKSRRPIITRCATEAISWRSPLNDPEAEAAVGRRRATEAGSISHLRLLEDELKSEASLAKSASARVQELESMLNGSR